MQAESKILKVLAVADGMVPSVTLVLAMPLAHLAEQGRLTYDLKLTSDGDLSGDVGRYDLLIVMRSCVPAAVDLVRAAKAQSVPVIYAIDDDYEAFDDSTELGRYFIAVRAWENVLEMCRMADQVWAFSAALKNKILPVQEKVVIPPAIASVETFDALRPREDGESVPLRLGYAATRYHAQDLEAITPALLEVLERIPELEIELIGVHGETLEKHPRVRHFNELPSIAEYYAFVLSRRWAAGLAPLLRSAANDAKTDNKYREYAAMGVPAVYARVPSYEQSVIDGYNGRLADGQEEWVEAVSALLEDREEARRLACNARREVEARYGLEHVAHRYLNYMRSAIAKPVRVVVISADIPTADIDIYRPLSRLAEEGLVTWERFELEQCEDSDLAAADMLVVVRVSDPHTVNCARRAQQQFSIPVVFSWDDDFFSIPLSLGAIAEHHRAPGMVAGLEELLRSADLVKASTERLAARSSSYSERVLRAPYGFDFSQLQGAPHAERHDSGEVRIGFFGSLSHLNALAGLMDALEEVAKLRPQASFHFFGPRNEKLEKLPRTTFIPYEKSAEASLRTLHGLGWDIGLAPLEVNEFNRAKLPTKYRDYGACHIAGVYTRIDPYTEVVTDGVTGLLVPNERDAWVEALLQLIDAPEERRRMAANAHAHVRNALSLDQAVEVWRGIVDTLVPQQHSASDPKLARMLDVAETQLAMARGQLNAMRQAAGSIVAAASAQGPGQERVAAAPATSLPVRIRRKLARMLDPHVAERNALPPIAGSILHPQPPSPDAQLLAHSVREERRLQRDDSALMPGVDLGQVPFVQSGSRVRGPFDTLIVATVAVIPAHGGRLGLELVSGGRIVVHMLQKLDDQDPNGMVTFRFDTVEFVGDEEIRFFARELPSPVHLLEWRAASDSVGDVVYRLDRTRTD